MWLVCTLLPPAVSCWRQPCPHCRDPYISSMNLRSWVAEWRMGGYSRETLHNSRTPYNEHLLMILSNGTALVVSDPWETRHLLGSPFTHQFCREHGTRWEEGSSESVKESCQISQSAMRRCDGYRERVLEFTCHFEQTSPLRSPVCLSMTVWLPFRARAYHHRWVEKRGEEERERKGHNHTMISMRLRVFSLHLQYEKRYSSKSPSNHCASQLDIHPLLVAHSQRTRNPA